METFKKYLSIGIYNKTKQNYIHTYNCLGCNKIFNTTHGYKNIKLSCYCRACCSRHGKAKAVSLKYYNKNKIWNYKSITDFCKHRTHSLGKNAKFHFTNVLKGYRLHYKGWINADNNIKIDKNKVKEIKQFLIKKAIVE